MTDEGRIAKFEKFVAEQRAKDSDLEALNVIVSDEVEAEAFAAELRERGWRAEAVQGMTFSSEKNEMQLRDFVCVELAEKGP